MPRLVLSEQHNDTNNLIINIDILQFLPTYHLICLEVLVTIWPDGDGKLVADKCLFLR